VAIGKARALGTRFLIVPGIGNSGPEHWQTLWEASNASFRRVQQRSWSKPVCAEWRSALDEAVKACGPDTVLIAHDLGCLLVVHWAAVSRRRVMGALLVAVPDPDAAAFPPQASGFVPVPRRKLPFPSVVIASTDDPLASMAYSVGCARAWGSKLVSIGAAGHIDASSGLGEWRDGHKLLQLFGS
jgi:uncharacterized protein